MLLMPTNTQEAVGFTGKGRRESHKNLTYTTGNINPDFGQPYQTTTYTRILALCAEPLNVDKSVADWIIPSTYHQSDARSFSVQKISGTFKMLVADIDEGNHTLADVVGAVRKAIGAGWQFCVYSTKSSTPEEKKWRVFVTVELANQDGEVHGIPGRVYSFFSDSFANHLNEFGITADLTAGRHGQISYLPNITDNYEHHIEEGAVLRLAGPNQPEHPISADAGAAYMAYTEQQKNKPAHRDTPNSPIGLFNRYFDIEYMLEHCGYTQHPHSLDDWRSPNSGQKGPDGTHAVKVYPDGNAFSLHESDSCITTGSASGAGVTCDAYALWRYYEKINDEDAKTFTDALRGFYRPADPKLLPDIAAAKAFSDRTVAHGRSVLSGMKIWDAETGRHVGEFATEVVIGENGYRFTKYTAEQALEVAGSSILRILQSSKNERVTQMSFTVEPWLPVGRVVGMFGRGEAGKSSFVSTLCAQASQHCSTLWVTSEEELENVEVRYHQSGGVMGTLYPLESMPKLNNSEERTVFDIYSHLEDSMLYAKREKANTNQPLKIVVLDAVTSLVTWGKGENANDDGAVKRLISRLSSFAETHELTIVMIGHLNKNTTRAHGADAVTGSAAWTNSVRNAFMFYKDEQAENEYESIVRTAKANTGSHFAARYHTVPVYELYTYENGHKDVLCKTELISDIVHGRDEINELFGDETQKAEAVSRKQQQQNLFSIALEAVRNGATSRAAIEEAVGTKINFKKFQKLDAHLLANSVTITKGERGVNVYSVPAAETTPWKADVG